MIRPTLLLVVCVAASMASTAPAQEGTPPQLIHFRVEQQSVVLQWDQDPVPWGYLVSFTRYDPEGPVPGYTYAGGVTPWLLTWPYPESTVWDENFANYMVYQRPSCFDDGHHIHCTRDEDWYLEAGTYDESSFTLHLPGVSLGESWRLGGDNPMIGVSPFEYSAVPEPSTLLSATSGIAALGIWRLACRRAAHARV